MKQDPASSTKANSPPEHLSKVLLCGPSRASVSGVATHLNQLFGSALGTKYNLVQFQVGSEGRVEGSAARLLRLLTSPFSLLSKVLSSKPDIVHLNSSLEPKAYWRDLAYLIVSKAMGCKVVYQVHGGRLPSKFLGPSAMAQTFLRWSLNLPDALVLLAETERLAYHNFKSGRRVVVIPNAVAQDGGVKTKNFDVLPVRLGYIGRLAHDKGVLETIHALKILIQSGFDHI
ncbi:MAG: glycosyltransferase, partial [Rubrivivax sp.]|nr:glycosyltransferase [Rubrivivax sp.]